MKPALRLPEVTLVMHETQNHALARLAVEDCVRKIEFAEVLIFTDRPLEFSPLTHICEPKFHIVADAPDKLGWCRQSWFEIPLHVRTSHMIFCQWDAGVWDADCWRREFLDYDFIGAPWPFHQTKKVGNSGFCLKSTRLARYVYNHRDVFQCDSVAEDDLLCRKYRPQLEEKGFTWAPESVARRFAFECEPPDMINKHLGFHAAFNFPVVFDHDDLRERVELMAASETLRDSQMMKWLCEKHPDVVKRIIDENAEAAE